MAYINTTVPQLVAGVTINLKFNVGIFELATASPKLFSQTSDTWYYFQDQAKITPFFIGKPLYVIG